MPKPTLLIILDGFGHSEASEHNPLHTAATPTLNYLNTQCPRLLLEASGLAVGLPIGQMGNSEVGHLHLGSGRKILQDLTRIDKAIAEGEFQQNPTLTQVLEQAKKNNSAVHIFGLLSPGGVHSHENHILALIKMIHDHGITKNYLHAFLDGRDTPPRSAMASLQRVTDLYKKLGDGGIAHIIGRYYAMDRDKRWERTQLAYDCLTLDEAPYHAADAMQALADAYARDESDEFVKPTAIHAPNQPAHIIRDNDVVIFMNFRADRARQITHAFIDQDFSSFPRRAKPNLSAYITLTEYDKNFKVPVAFPTVDIHNTLGEIIAQNGLRQLRVAETEKYAHVTYFLNGGYEHAYPGEDRVLIPSPKVATYDLHPEMSAVEITDKLVGAILGQEYDAIICNYANPDMVGHTGLMDAAIQAIHTIDECLGRVLQALQEVGGQALITADHGNIEMMFDDAQQQPHTAHTTNLVPLYYVGPPVHFTQTQGALDDVAPTMLYLMDLPIPTDMTGQCLLEKN